DTLDDAVSFLTVCRTTAWERDLHGAAAQVPPDLGSTAGGKGERDRAVEFYELAIAEREAIGDVQGRTWTLNNLANLRLREGRLDDALPPLLAAWRAVHEEDVVLPQAAVAFNVKTVLDLLAGETPLDAKRRTWVWTLAEVAAKSEVPEIVSSAWLLRWAALEENARWEDGVGRQAARRVMEHLPVGQPAEGEADLTLFAADLARDDGGASDAGRWLEKLAIPPGLLAPHLEARRTLAQALVAGERKKKKDFARRAVAAARAWRDLGDRSGRLAALGALLEEAQAFELPVAGDLEHELEALRRSGTPGGLGGSASGGGDRTGYDALGPHDPLFGISLVEGRLRVEDIVADRHVDVDVLWQPRNVGLNGLSVTFLGGWVRIESLSYGGAAVASGVPASMDLEDFGPRWPIPGNGALLILKNGAVAWK
ncbi:MAG: hypothetical protein ACC662_08300, partial [Planctomycetota bacterium]